MYTREEGLTRYGTLQRIWPAKPPCQMHFEMMGTQELETP